MKASIYVRIIVIALLLSFNPVARANVTVVPSVTVKEQYNDNIFLTDSDEEDDFISYITPRLEFEYYPNRYLDLNLDYSLQFRFFSDHDELNDTSLRETQNADFHAQVRPLHRVFIDVDDTYGRVNQDIRSKVAADNESTNMTEKNVFRVSPYIEVPFTSTLFSRFGYRYIDTWYEAEEGDDSKANSFYTSLIKKFPAHVSVSLNYDFTAMRPELTSDYDRHQGYISVNYGAVSNLEVWGKIGRAYIDFEDRDNEESTFWDLGSEYKIKELGDSTVTVLYSRHISESEGGVYRDSSELTQEETASIISEERNSISTGVSEVERISLIFVLRKQMELKIGPRYEKIEEIETDREDEIWGIDATFRKPLSTKLTMVLDGFWEEQKFMPVDNKVRNYSVSGSLEYIISRYITAGTGYRYNDRDSNEVGDDYQNSIVWLEARVTFR